jgi:hypothetical protein
MVWRRLKLSEDDAMRYKLVAFLFFLIVEFKSQRGGRRIEPAAEGNRVS